MEEKLTAIIPIRCTPEEKRAFDEAARAAGMKASPYGRWLLREARDMHQTLNRLAASAHRKHALTPVYGRSTPYTPGDSGGMPVVADLTGRKRQ